MTKLEKTLYDLILPLVDNKDELKIVESTNRSNKVIYLNVEVNDEDLGRLIGRRGNTANSIRQTMQIASRLENKRIMVNFKSNEDA